MLIKIIIRYKCVDVVWSERKKEKNVNYFSPPSHLSINHHHHHLIMTDFFSRC